MTIWTPSSRSPLSRSGIAGAVGGVVMTLLLRAEYEQLFGMSPFSAPLLDEPFPLLVGSLLTGSVLVVLLIRWSDERVGVPETVALALTTALLPAVVVTALAVRVGVVTGFGPTVTVKSFAHFVVGMFFVLFYAGFGAAVAGFVFLVVFVGSGVGALLSGGAIRRFADRP